MTIQMLAIDLGKQSFHLHAIDDDGVVISRKVCRSKLDLAVAELAPVVVAMEACASAHHWGRRFTADGRKVLLINPRFVKAFVRGSKNDAVDAEAIRHRPGFAPAFVVPAEEDSEPAASAQVF